MSLDKRYHACADLSLLTPTCVSFHATTTISDVCDHTQARASEQTSALKAEVQAAQALATTAHSEAAAVKLEKTQLASTTQQQAQQAAAAKAQVRQVQLLLVELVQVACVCFDTNFITLTLLCGFICLAYRCCADRALTLFMHMLCYCYTSFTNIYHSTMRSCPS
jgi:hypothetical protein